MASATKNKEPTLNTKEQKKICFVLTFVCIFYLFYTLFASFFPFNCKMQNVHCFTQPMTARRKNRDVDDEKLFRSARRFEKIYFCACAEFHVQRWTIASKTSFWLCNGKINGTKKTSGQQRKINKNEKVAASNRGKWTYRQKQRYITYMLAK